MNSIRGFVEHLGKDLELVSWSHLAEAFALDGRLLEAGLVSHKEFNIFPFWKEENILAWVVVYNSKPYMISGFDIPAGICVFIQMREIKEGCKLPCTIASADLEICDTLAHAVERGVKLANCPVKTYNWLKSHKATRKVIERISKPA